MGRDTKTCSSPKSVLSLGASTQAGDCYPEKGLCSPKGHQENDQGPMRRWITYISPKELRDEGGLGIHWALGCMHLWAQSPGWASQAAVSQQDSRWHQPPAVVGGLA